MLDDEEDDDGHLHDELDEMVDDEQVDISLHHEQIEQQIHDDEVEGLQMVIIDEMADLELSL
ncbi:MAG: hypothetical protein ACOZBL_05645 [Patescibacteria group bacterium]